MNYHHKKHKGNDDNIEAAVADEEELNDFKPTPNRTASISSGVGDHIGGGEPSSQQRSKTTTSTSTTHHSSTTKHPTQTIEVVDKGKSSSPTHDRQQRASSGTVQIHPSEHQSRHSHLSHTTTTTSMTTTTSTSAANNTTSSSTDQRNQQQRRDREDGEGGEGSSSSHLVTVKISKL